MNFLNELMSNPVYIVIFSFISWFIITLIWSVIKDIPRNIVAKIKSKTPILTNETSSLGYFLINCLFSRK